MINDPNRQFLLDMLLSNTPPSIKKSLLNLQSFTNKHKLNVTTIISVQDPNVSFDQIKLLGAIREAFTNPQGETMVEDREGQPWQLSTKAFEGRKFTVLTSPIGEIKLSYFWPLSPDLSERLEYLEKEASQFNLANNLVDKWMAILTSDALSNSDFSQYSEDISLTPTHFLNSLMDRFNFGKVTINDLVPKNSNYYSNLVGTYDPTSSLESFSQQEGRDHLVQLLAWNHDVGLKLALLSSAHSMLINSLVHAPFTESEIEKVILWAKDQSDFYSLLGVIELAFAHLKAFPKIEGHLFELISTVKDDDPELEGGRFSLLSNLIVLVLDEFARTKIFLGRSPFWVRMAGIAQASIIERVISSTTIDRKEFDSWAGDARGQYFFLQTLIELRREPRWLPDFISPTQLKAEFLGRIASAATIYQEFINSPELRHLVIDEVNPKGLRSLLQFPFAFLPGPLEGAFESIAEMPTEFRSLIDSELRSAPLSTNNFARLVNSALIFKITPDHAQSAAATLRDVQYQLQQPEGGSNMSALIPGLATVSAVTRTPDLANEVRILNRIYRRRLNSPINYNSEIEIALIAAASHENLSDWAKFVGDWITEIAFEVPENGPNDNFLPNLLRLTELEPALLPTCAKGIAAISSLIR